MSFAQAVTSWGELLRLWVTYQRCCDDVPAFGEIRHGYLKSAYHVCPRVHRMRRDPGPGLRSAGLIGSPPLA